MNHEATIETLNAQLDNCAKDLYEKDKRIAELERQLAEASAPAVEQQPIMCADMPVENVQLDAICYYLKHNTVFDADGLQKAWDDLVKFYVTRRSAPQAADTDKAREALNGLHNAIMNLPCKVARAVAMHGATEQAYKEGHRDARHAAAELAASMAAQAPVREVPDPEPDMLWQADEPEDGVFGSSPKDFAENYASAAVGRGETHDVDVLCATRSHKRTMRVSVSADEDAENWLHWEWADALPAAPVQQEGASNG